MKITIKELREVIREEVAKIQENPGAPEGSIATKGGTAEDKLAAVLGLEKSALHRAMTHVKTEDDWKKLDSATKQKLVHAADAMLRLEPKKIESDLIPLLRWVATSRTH